MYWKTTVPIHLLIAYGWFHLQPQGWVDGREATGWQALYSLASYRTRFLTPILEDGSSRKLSPAPWDVLAVPHQAPATLALLFPLQTFPH